MRHTGIEFTEIHLPLYTSSWNEKIRNYSRSYKVPVLADGSVSVWDLLAICEYLVDKLPERRLWPAAAKARALARSASAEMRSGFADLRTQLPMNMRWRLPGRCLAPAVKNDIDRVISIWNDARTRFGTDGPFLFGEFSIADAMYTPVVSRFTTCSVELAGNAAHYAQTILKLHALHAWYTEAQSETEVIAGTEL